MQYEQITAADTQGVYDTALESWMVTYKEIYGEDSIRHFVDENYSEKALSPFIQGADDFFFVAKDGQQVVAYCHVGKANGQLYRIYVRPNYMKKGIGSQLMEHATNYAKQHNIPKIFCYVHRLNKEATLFYDKVGFTHKEEHDLEHEWYMEKVV